MKQGAQLSTANIALRWYCP